MDGLPSFRFVVFGKDGGWSWKWKQEWWWDYKEERGGHLAGAVASMYGGGQGARDCDACALRPSPGSARAGVIFTPVARVSRGWRSIWATNGTRVLPLSCSKCLQNEVSTCQLQLETSKQNKRKCLLVRIACIRSANCFFLEVKTVCIARSTATRARCGHIFLAGHRTAPSSSKAVYLAVSTKVPVPRTARERDASYLACPSIST